MADERAGADACVAIRAEWDPLIARFAPALGYAVDEIDPASNNPETADERPHFRARLRSVS